MSKAENTKVERRSEWEQRQMMMTGREKQVRKIHEGRDAKRSDIALSPGHILQSSRMFISFFLCSPFSAFSSLPFYLFSPSFPCIFSFLLTAIIHPQSFINTELV